MGIYDSVRVVWGRANVNLNHISCSGIRVPYTLMFAPPPNGSLWAIAGIEQLAANIWEGCGSAVSRANAAWYNPITTSNFIQFWPVLIELAIWNGPLPIKCWSIRQRLRSREKLTSWEKDALQKIVLAIVRYRSETWATIKKVRTLIALTKTRIKTIIPGNIVQEENRRMAPRNSRYEELSAWCSNEKVQMGSKNIRY